MISSMFRKLSGEESPSKTIIDEDSSGKKLDPSPLPDGKKGKRTRSGNTQSESGVKEQRRKRSRTSKKSTTSPSKSPTEPTEDGEIVSSEEEEEDEDADDSTVHIGPVTDPVTDQTQKICLPPETPDWGVKLFQWLQNEFRNVTSSVHVMENDNTEHGKSIQKIERKLERAEL